MKHPRPIRVFGFLAAFVAVIGVPVLIVQFVMAQRASLGLVMVVGGVLAFALARAVDWMVE